MYAVSIFAWSARAIGSHATAPKVMCVSTRDWWRRSRVFRVRFLLRKIPRPSALNVVTAVPILLPLANIDTRSSLCRSSCAKMLIDQGEVDPLCSSGADVYLAPFLLWV